MTVLSIVGALILDFLFLPALLLLGKRDRAPEPVVGGGIQPATA